MVQQMTEYTTELDDVIDDVKRLYTDFDITLPCPQCKRPVEWGNDYFSYGDMNFHFYCCEDEGGCEHEWEVRAKNWKVTMTVEL